MVLDMGLSKNRGKKTQNGWFISWKTLLKWDDLGGGVPIIYVKVWENPCEQRSKPC